MRLIHTLQARASCIGSRHREGITEVDRFYMHQRRDRGDFSVLSFFFFYTDGIVLDGTFVTPRLLSRACIPLARVEESRLWCRACYEIWLNDRTVVSCGCKLDYSSVLLPPSPLAGRIDGSVLRRLILLFFNMVAWSEQRNKEILVECN